MATERDLIGGEGLRMVISLILVAAALHLVAIEFASTNILVDTLGLTGTTLQATIGAFGLAAAVEGYNTAVLAGLTE